MEENRDVMALFDEKDGSDSDSGIETPVSCFLMVSLNLTLVRHG